MTLRTIATIAAGIAGAAFAVSAHAQEEFRPAVVYDMGGKFDKSFNEGVYNGITRFTTETGTEVMEFEVTNEAQREQAITRMAQRGATVVLGVGFSQADAIDKVSSENPDKEFAIIDVYWLDQPNLRQYRFAEHEGSYLVGVAAAMASDSGTIGFVGGMDIPLIRKFECGFRQGVMATNPDAEVVVNYTGTTPAAWNDPTKGAELARSQIDRGADVVYHAAGGTGLGVIRAAADAGKLAIGVDSDQAAVAPGSVLTSMLKRVDVAAYDTMMDAKNGEFTPGIVNLGLAEEGVGYVADENNAELLTEEMRTAMEEAKAKIIAGEISVHDYETDQSCPL
jgi:basic membrane protein A